MQHGRKAVWSIPYVFVSSFFPSLKQNFMAYRSSTVSDCIFEIHQLWQSGFSRMYSNCYSSCSFEPEIIKIGQSSHKMYSNKILNFQESTTILNAHTKKVWKFIVCTSYKHKSSEELCSQNICFLIFFRFIKQICQFACRAIVNFLFFPLFINLLYSRFKLEREDFPLLFLWMCYLISN